MDNEQTEDQWIQQKEARQILGFAPSTLRAWAEKGILKSKKSPTGRFMFSRKSIQDIVSINSPSYKNRKKIVYCRVSSRGQMEDLARQRAYMESLYPDHILVQDIASGINWKRKGLETILELAIQGNLEELVVAHKDRLSRFAFDFIKSTLEKCGATVIVLDSGENKSTEQELAEDLLSIVHIYSCRSMGKRRYKTKKDKNSSNTASSDDGTKTNVV